jgi:Skp family chaperone for outer membrane proteins
MSDTKPSHASAPFEALLAASPLPMVGKTFEVWFKFEADLLASIQATMTELMGRQQEAAAAAREAFVRMAECRKPTEFWKIQQEFWSDCAQRTASNGSAVSATLLEFSRKTAADLETAGRAVMESARESGGELLRAAGSKPTSD